MMLLFLTLVQVIQVELGTMGLAISTRILELGHWLRLKLEIA